ncbi:MAG TPA: Fe-S cluster assembly protein HesB [Rhodoglobus sp.]|nr:Fe-S cluster assembly protein HesB [Rhodoglobus sp.]
MLTLTDTASTVVKTIVDQSPATETGGLRIQSTDQPEGRFEVSVASEPEATDSVVERDGARVFLDSGTAGVLDDKTLDAQVDDTGAVQFALTPQG